MSRRYQRKRPVPALKYPANLPIVHRRSEIINAIQRHQIVIVSGETGSGKTTQLPKICLEAGRGLKGLIGCTQPRRIAALTIAARIAEEMGDESAVGCRIRFHDSSNPENFIRVMTDGILLAEIQKSPNLSAYDTIIIDEAHERSLNIDVLLGMMKRLAARRETLKLIITSATLDTQEFSKHFNDAPIIEVSGRVFPVDIRYMPPEDSSVSLAENAAFCVKKIMEESRRGDILVFQPTEQDIRETIELVSREFSGYLNILPLYARLPASQQQKAFELGGRRKLVVATNVAETSLTIPGIRYVVDTGLARISRYNPGTGTHGLPIGLISRASADQRAGRCGRVADGICIRLYSEENYRTRPEYTPPEIKRTNLAEVVLRLLSLGIEDIEKFPFVAPPLSAGIRDGLRTLREIGALDTVKHRRLTSSGRLMSRLPIDPRLAKMLIQADKETCLGDVLPIVAALSIHDPREIPPEKKSQALSAHAVFRDENSDFISWLNIWDALHSRKGKESYTGRIKKFCKENFLSFRRMREWMDVHRQLALVMEENGYRIRRMKTTEWIDRHGHFTPRYLAIHRSLLSGLLSHIARCEEEGVYLATRNRKAFIHPGSALKKSSVPWIVAAELVNTSRLFARLVAAIDPQWLEDLAAHLVKKSWNNPHWSQKTGAVMAEEQTRLFGFLIAEGKMVPYGPINPLEAREIFIKSYLVESASSHTRDYSFLKNNQNLLERLQGMEAKLRRKDLLVGEEELRNFYINRIPETVLDTASLNRALKTEKGLDKALQMSEDDLLQGMDVGSDLEFFPDKASISGESWSLSYIFDPDSHRDGVTLKIPAGHLDEIREGDADWVVPGLLKEKVEALIRGLPKKYRRLLIPIAETVDGALRGMNQEGNLAYALSAWLYSERRIDIPPGEWDMEGLPTHLKVRLSLLDDAGRETATGYNPARLEPVNHGGRASGQISGGRLVPDGPASLYKKNHEKSDLTSWPGNIPETVEIGKGAILWSALNDDGDSVSLRFFDLKSQALAAHRQGQQRLAMLHWAREIGNFRKQLQLTGQVRVTASQLGGVDAIEEAVWNRVTADVFVPRVIRNEEEWAEMLASGGRRIYPVAQSYFEQIETIFSTYGEVISWLRELVGKGHRVAFLEACITDTQTMVGRDFILREPMRVWEALPRWLCALKVRARRGVENPAREQRFQQIWMPLSHRLQQIIDNLSVMASDEKCAALREAVFMMEELRLSLTVGGEIRTTIKISESKMKKALDELDRML